MIDNTNTNEYKDDLFKPNLNKKLIMTDISNVLSKDNETEVSHMYVYKSRSQDILDKFFS